MKEPAHLPRGAFYVLLAVCVIPFALGQRPDWRGTPKEKPIFRLGSTPTPTPTPTLCDSGIIVNGGFETGSFPPWVIDGTNNPPVVTNFRALAGYYSAFAGGNPEMNQFCGSGGAEPLGDSSFYQQFTVPAGLSIVSFWYRTCTTDSIVFDWQDAYITDTNGNILQTIFHQCTDSDPEVINQVVDMTPYAGQTVRLKFLVHQDGYGDLTGIWVDTVALLLPCGTPTPTATATPTATPCASGGSWTEQAPYPISISGAAGAAQGGNIYSFGGLSNGTPTTAAYKYTPATNSWSAIAPLPAARYWFSAVSDGTYVYLLGGLNQNGFATATLWRYDPATNTYNTSLPPYTIPTYFHASAYLNGKIYRIAGRGKGTDYHVEVYTISTNSWSFAGNFPGADQMLMAAALGGYIYAGGGDGTGCSRYDPVTDIWTFIASLPAVRSLAASDAYNGRWVLAGGDVSFVISNSVIAYDPATNAWMSLPNMLAANDHLFGATVGQAFHALGGSTDNEQFIQEVCAPSATPTPTATPTCTPSGSWVERAPYPVAVSGNAVVSQGGNVYGFGGIANNIAIANAYKYTPATNSWSPIAPLPAARYGLTAVSDGTYVYLLGGVDQNSNTTATLWRYDPISNDYNTSLPSYTIPTYDHVSVYLNGKIYRIAGRDMGYAYSQVEVYDIGTNTWSMVANYPFTTYSLMAAALGGYIYAGGGEDSPEKTYRYDPNTNSWDDGVIADLPAYRLAAASGVYNGRWVLAGGEVNSGISSSVMAWDPASNTWSNLPNMVQPRDNPGGATVGESFYVVAGSSGPGTPANDNQQYTEVPCGTPTPTATATATTTPTPTPTATPCTGRCAPTPRPRPTPVPRP